MVWLIAGLPASAVVAAFATYFIAAHEPDSMVKAEYRKDGLTVVSPQTAADSAAAAIQLFTQLRIREGQIEARIQGGLMTPPARLRLNIVHPTQEKADIHILLEQSRELSYIAPAPDVGTGKRLLVMEPEDGSWRITGQWMAPFSGMTELAAATQNHSTHP